MVKRAFSRGILILVNVDREELTNPINSDKVKKYYTKQMCFPGFPKEVIKLCYEAQENSYYSVYVFVSS